MCGESLRNASKVEAPVAGSEETEQKHNKNNAYAQTQMIGTGNPVAQPEEEEETCPMCGYPLAPHYTECPNCGYELVDVTAPVAPAAAEAPKAPEVPPVPEAPQVPELPQAPAPAAVLGNTAKESIPPSLRGTILDVRVEKVEEEAAAVAPQPAAPQPAAPQPVPTQPVETKPVEPKPVAPPKPAEPRTPAVNLKGTVREIPAAPAAGGDRAPRPNGGAFKQTIRDLSGKIGATVVQNPLMEQKYKRTVREAPEEMLRNQQDVWLLIPLSPHDKSIELQPGKEIEIAGHRYLVKK